MNFAAWALGQAQDMGHLDRLIDVAAKGPIKLGSLCSGLDVFVMVALCLRAAWVDLAVVLPHLPDLQFVHEFSCELDDKKRELLRTRPGFSGSQPKHLFADVTDLACGLPVHCSIVQRLVHPERPDVMMAGWSCKDLSGLKSHMQVPFGIGGSGCSSTTFSACFTCVRLWLPAIVIFENVKGVVQRRSADNGQRPIDQIMQLMHSSGYNQAHALLNSNQFGLPQSRPRTYMFFSGLTKAILSKLFDVWILSERRFFP